jgi:HPt (histidine-containing phosphotransfer) domain-containing protein
MVWDTRADHSDPVWSEIAALQDAGVLLDRFGGDEDLMKDVTRAFIEELRMKRAALADDGSLESGSAECAKCVHGLASSLSPFGLGMLSRRCIEVEAAIREERRDEAREGIADIRSYLDALENTLRSLAVA